MRLPAKSAANLAGGEIPAPCRASDTAELRVKDDSWRRSKLVARALVVVWFPLPSPSTTPHVAVAASDAPVIRRTVPGCRTAAAAPEPTNITATQMIVMGFNHLQCYFWVSDISHPWGQDSHLHPLSQNTDFCTVDGNSAPFSVEPAAISTDRCQVHVFTEQAPHIYLQEEASCRTELEGSNHILQAGRVDDIHRVEP